MRNYRTMARLALPVLAAGLAVSIVGTAAAHTGSGTAIAVTPTGGTSISVSGSWHWGGISTATVPSYVGYAVDWGDVTSGNDVGAYHIGDGTAATNVVMQPTTPATGGDGTWGPVSHTYAQAGTYTACVIIYDLGTNPSFATTGYHSTQAGGTNHNTDNSVDKGSATPAVCATFSVVGPSPSVTALPSTPPSGAPSASAVPTATPFQSALGATSDPGSSSTPPPTATLGTPVQGDGGSPLLLLLILVMAMFGSVLVYGTSRVRR